LNASQCHSFTGANLNAHNLKSLDASRCNSFTTGANLNTPNLIALNLSDSGFQGNVPNSPNLELLDISLCNHINASVLTSSMANKVNLRVLTNDDYGRQSNCGRFNNNRNDWITNDVLIGLLANNKCIESIDIGGRIAIELTNSGLRAALKEAGNLKRLSIKGCPGITDEGLMDALQGKDKLNYLNVQSCDVTDAAIKSLRKKFPRATIIDQKGKEVPNLSASHLTRLDKGSNHSIVAGI
jgi:hypothetical protein